MLLLAAPAVAAEAPPPGTHFEAITNASPADQAAPSAELAMAGDGFERLTVPVSLGGSRPYRFLVDTGSDRTSVSWDLARELGLVQGPSAMLHSATGQSEVRMAHLPELRMNRRTVRNIRAPMLDARDMGADGILGIDSLRAQRVVFDFSAGTLSVLSAEAATDIEEGAIIVRARRREGRLVITNAEIDGVRVTVVLDTGSALTVGNGALWRKLERGGSLSRSGPIDLISVTGALIRAELASVKGLEIGGARLDGLAIAFADAHTFRRLKLDRRPAILLGMNALKGFDQVAIDFAGKTVAFVLPKERKPARG